VFQRTVTRRYKIILENLKEKYDYSALLSVDDSGQSNHNSKSINSLIETNQLIGDNSRIAGDAISRGREILGSLDRSYALMEVES